MSWTAALIDAPTHARKTHKTFEILTNKLQNISGNILGLFITQSNSTMSAMQVLNRITNNDDLLKIFPKNNIIRSIDFDNNSDGNLMVVDYWHTRNTDKMLNIAKDYIWDKIVIIYDEIDQGNIGGVYNRFSRYF